MGYCLKTKVSFVLVVLHSVSGGASAWQEIKPAGEARCARGDEFVFFYQEKDPNKLLIDFEGGGACWDARSCNNGSLLFKDTIERNRNPGSWDKGVLSSRQNHAFSDYSKIVIPYCTGDVHWGQKTVRYRPDVNIHHSGATNVRTVLDWLENRKNINTVSDVFVTGCSAGAYGSIYWTPQIREIFNEARLSQVGDSGAGVMSRRFIQNLVQNWNPEANAPDWIDNLAPHRKSWRDIEIADLYGEIGKHYPEITLGQFNWSEDYIQDLFYVVSGGNWLDWSFRMNRNMRQIRQSTSNFNYFISPGTDHCIFTENEYFTHVSDGKRLQTWVESRHFR